MTKARNIDTIDNQTSFRASRFIMLVGAMILMGLLMMALPAFLGAGAGPLPESAENRLTIPVLIHIATVTPAIPLGTYILWAKKGDALHKLLGKIWAVLMLTTAVTSLFIVRPGEGIAGTGFSFIHILSVIVLVHIPLAIWRIRKGDVKGHQRAMMGPYIGLILAGLFAFLPERLLGMLAFG